MCKVVRSSIQVVMLTVILVTCGCRSSLCYQAAVWQDQKLYDELSRYLKSVYPDQYKATHRVILSIYDRQIDLTGYLMANREGKFRLLAMGEFGTVCLDISSDNDNITIHKNLFPFSQKKLGEGVLNDIRAIGLWTPIDRMQLVRMSDGRPALSYTLKNEIYYYIFNNDRRLEEYAIISQGHCRYKVEFREWKQGLGLSQQVPITMQSVNHDLHYTLAVTVMNLKETPFKADLIDLTLRERQ